MKSIFDGYLTDGCANCPDWADGSDDRGYGCATHYPIDLCPHFAKMVREEELKRQQLRMEINEKIKNGAQA